MYNAHDWIDRLFISNSNLIQQSGQHFEIE